MNEIKKDGVMDKLFRYFRNLGPGLTTGAADDDPSGIATYSQMGASKGLGLVWVSLFSLPLMSSVQEMCGRIGLVTGVGLASNIKRHYTKKVLYLLTILLLAANIFNIGADLGAMAEGVKLLLPKLNFSFLVIFFSLVSLVLQVLVSYKSYAKYLKYLALALFSYVASALFVKMDWMSVLHSTVIPNLEWSKENVFLICAALGTTISPYLFFWQTEQEIEEEILLGEETEELRKNHTSVKEIKAMRVDVFSGMTLSNLVMFFIIAISAGTLFKNGITNINTAADAALALKPLAGDAAYFLFTMGILGTGLLSVPILAGSASYAVSQSFGWEFGLYKKWRQATYFYGVIAVSMCLGMLLNFIGLDPIKTLIYSSVLNGIVSPVILYYIVKISADEKIMGDYKNKKLSNFLGWLTVGIMTTVSVATILFILL